jgi:hypothetical protein
MFDVSAYTLEHVLDVNRHLEEYGNGGISLIYSSWQVIQSERL